MADVLGNRGGTDTPIFRVHVERTLKQHADKMNETQNRKYSAFKNPDFRGRSFTENDRQLVYTQSALYRFVDMKRLRKPGGYQKGNGAQYRRKKVYDVHNRVIMGHYSGIMKDLTYGAAQEVAEEMRNNLPGDISINV